MADDFNLLNPRIVFTVDVGNINAELNKAKDAVDEWLRKKEGKFKLHISPTVSVGELTTKLGSVNTQVGETEQAVASLNTQLRDTMRIRIGEVLGPDAVNRFEQLLGITNEVSKAFSQVVREQTIAAEAARVEAEAVAKANAEKEKSARVNARAAEALATNSQKAANLTRLFNRDDIAKLSRGLFDTLVEDSKSLEKKLRNTGDAAAKGLALGLRNATTAAKDYRNAIDKMPEFLPGGLGKDVLQSMKSAAEAVRDVGNAADTSAQRLNTLFVSAADYSEQVGKFKSTKEIFDEQRLSRFKGELAGLAGVSRGVVDDLLRTNTALATREALRAKMAADQGDRLSRGEELRAESEGIRLTKEKLQANVSLKRATDDTAAAQQKASKLLQDSSANSQQLNAAAKEVAASYNLQLQRIRALQQAKDAGKAGTVSQQDIDNLTKANSKTRDLAIKLKSMAGQRIIKAEIVDPKQDLLVKQTASKIKELRRDIERFPSRTFKDLKEAKAAWQSIRTRMSQIQAAMKKGLGTAKMKTELGELQMLAGQLSEKIAAIFQSAAQTGRTSSLNALSNGIRTFAFDIARSGNGFTLFIRQIATVATSGGKLLAGALGLGAVAATGFGVAIAAVGVIVGGAIVAFKVLSGVVNIALGILKAGVKIITAVAEGLVKVAQSGAELAFRGIGKAVAFSLAPLNQLVQGLKQVTYYLPLISSFGTIAFFRDVTKTAIGFDKSVTKLASNMGLLDRQGQKFIDLRQQLLKAAEESPKPVTEVAEAANILAKAGFQQDQIFGVGDEAPAIKVVLDLAVVSDKSVGETAKIITAAVNTFGVAAGKTREVADAVRAASTVAQIDIEDFGKTLESAGFVAKRTGIEIEELAAYTAQFGRQGLKGEKAGTALRRGITELLTAANNPKQKQALNKVLGRALGKPGDVAENYIDEFLDATRTQFKEGGFTDLLEQLGGAGRASLQDLDKIIGARGQFFVGLLGAGGAEAIRDIEKIVRLGQEFNEGEGVVAAQRRLVDESTAGQLDLIKAKYESIKILLVAPLRGGAVDFLKLVNEQMQKVIEFLGTDVFKASLISVASEFRNIAAAILPVIQNTIKWWSTTNTFVVGFVGGFIRGALREFKTTMDIIVTRFDLMNIKAFSFAKEVLKIDSLKGFLDNMRNTFIFAAAFGAEVGATLIKGIGLAVQELEVLVTAFRKIAELMGKILLESLRVVFGTLRDILVESIVKGIIESMRVAADLLEKTANVPGVGMFGGVFGQAALALRAGNKISESLTGKSQQDLIADGMSQLAFTTGSFTGDVKQLVQDGASQLAQQINNELEAIGKELAGLSNTEAIEQIRAGLEEAARKANEAVRKVEEDIASGKADTGKEQEKMDEERAALAEYEKQLRALQDRLSKQARGQMDTGVFEPDTPTTADRGQSLVDAAQFFNAIQAGGAVTPGERITHTKQDELINEIRGLRRDANINAGMPDLDAAGVGPDADLEQ